MKAKKIFFTGLLIITVLTGAGLLFNQRYHIFSRSTLADFGPETKPTKDIYCCPMHPGFTSDKPGNCSICGMNLVKKELKEGIEKKNNTSQEICLLHNCPMTNCQMKISGNIRNCPFCGAHLIKEKKILYYRNPMNPQATSSVPLKDSMGMEYVPVYESESEGGVYIAPSGQQLVGIKKEKVLKRKLTRQILTVGRVAYDPGLFVAQEEYLQVLKAGQKIQDSRDDLMKEQMNSLAEAGRKKLLLLGMSDEEIAELTQKGSPQENLYLPLQDEKVWVYAAIYEYEISLIKEGLPVEIEAVAFPGETFSGKITALLPVLDAMTRSAQARIEVDNGRHLLKPQMYVDIKIDIDLGEKLAVSEEAVMDTGERKMVFVARPNGYFVSREVKLGALAQGYYEVLSGLNEGEEVVSSGNFFVDSESKLKSALGEAASEDQQQPAGESKAGI